MEAWAQCRIHSSWYAHKTDNDAVADLFYVLGNKDNHEMLGY